MLSRLSIQWKITLLAGLCLLAIVTLLVGASLYQSTHSAALVKTSSSSMLEDSARLRMAARGELQGIRIQRYFMDAYQYGKGFSRQVLFLKEQAEKRFLDAFDLREDMTRQVRSSLEANPNLLGLYLVYEANALDGKDELFAEILMHMLDCCASDLEHPYRADQPLQAQLLALLESKLRMFEDARFLDFVRVAIAEAVHSPERARAMIERIGEREQGVTAWIRAAQADGRLIDVDPAFAAMQLQGLVKTFAFWPQIAFGQPTLTPAMQRQVAESTAAMFLAHYAVQQDT